MYNNLGKVSLEHCAQYDKQGIFNLFSTSWEGLTDEEASKRRKQFGFNDLVKRKVRVWQVFLRQFRNPLVIIFFFATSVSFFLGHKVDALIIFFMLITSSILSFFNEYRSEKIAENLSKKISPKATVVRNKLKIGEDVRNITVGDLIFLTPGSIIPADLRLVDVDNLEIDESVLTGESFSVYKTDKALVLDNPSPSELANCVFMGTSVITGTGLGVVISTGQNTKLGEISKTVTEIKPMTDFEKGIYGFGSFLFKVIFVLVLGIFIINQLLGHTFFNSILFALAIAIGLTPELLFAVVTVGLSRGSHKLAKKEVVVKQMVAIEDLGNIDILCTDKTGTLTKGEIKVADFLDGDLKKTKQLLEPGLLCNSVVSLDHKISGDAIDIAIWNYVKEKGGDLEKNYQKIHEIPFDFERKMMSVVIEKNQKRILIVKGAGEKVLEKCKFVKNGAKNVLIESKIQGLKNEFIALSRKGFRVIALAQREIGKEEKYDARDEKDLSFLGFITFFDPPKETAFEAISKLNELSVSLKIITGDNELVTQKVCSELHLPLKKTVLGQELMKIKEKDMERICLENDIFARVTPEQKLQIIRALRRAGHAVGYIGDGINDVLALHEADVGISVNDAVDVAKEAATVVLLRKSLNVVTDGIIEGRKIFSNTMKYILMDTSSNFGNMFSAAGGSFFLPFLPMLPAQILLNNLLYDFSQLTLPADNVDLESLKKPKKWNVQFIRNYMLFFGPISSLYDFLTFGILLFVFKAGESLFQTGWFIESLATQVLVVFIIRTARFPFLKSKPSKLLITGCFSIVAIGIIFSFTKIGKIFKFTPLPPQFLFLLIILVVTYLFLVEIGKRFFFKKFAL